MKKQIEEIKDCIDSVYGCDCAYFGVDGLAIAAAIYNADYRKQEWISVDERLPEEDEAMRYFNFGNVIVMTVLAACNKTVQLKNRVFDGENWEWSPQTNYYEEVTHWMPLPEPPKGDAE